MEQRMFCVLTRNVHFSDQGPEKSTIGEYTHSFHISTRAGAIVPLPSLVDHDVLPPKKKKILFI